MAMTLLERKRKSAAKARACRRTGKDKRSFQPRSLVIASEAISPDVMYPVALIPSRLGISKRAIDRAKLAGLRTRRMGNKEFVKGEWLIQHMEDSPDEQD